MVALQIAPARLRGRVRLPGDRAMGNVALTLAALAEGESLVRGIDPARHRDLIAALRAMQVPVSSVNEGVRIKGVGLFGLCAPKGALHAEHDWSLALLGALLSAQRFGTRVTAGRGIAHTPVHGLVQALRERGAQIAGTAGEEGGLTPPLSVAPLLEGESLHEAELAIAGGDALAKIAMLISGLYVRGLTAVSEGMLSPDHCERALLTLGLPVQTLGPLAVLDLAEAAPRWGGFDWEVPADGSLFALLAAAVLSRADSDVVFEQVSFNPTRTGFLDALRHAGADVALSPRGESASGEPWGSVRVQSGGCLRSLQVGGELAFRMLGEQLALCALVPAAGGRVQLRDVPQSRARPLRRASSLLRELGIESTAYDDGIDVDPGRGRSALRVDCEGDSELAWLALAVALAGEVDVRLERAEGVFALYPEALPALQSIGARCRLEESP